MSLTEHGLSQHRRQISRQPKSEREQCQWVINMIKLRLANNELRDDVRHNTELELKHWQDKLKKYETK